jgi:hypothetical protein
MAARVLTSSAGTLATEITQQRMRSLRVFIEPDEFALVKSSWTHRHDAERDANSRE